MKSFAWLLASAIFLTTLPVFAQEKTDPKDIVLGVVIVKLDSEYPIVEADGALWEDFFYEDDGLSLYVEQIDRTKDHTIRLKPIYDDQKFADLKVKPKDWKLAKLDKETRQWQASFKVGFKKWKPGEREKFLEEEARKKKAEPPPEEKKVEPPAEDKKVEPPPEEKKVEPPQEEKKVEPPAEEKKAEPPKVEPPAEEKKAEPPAEPVPVEDTAAEDAPAEDQPVEK